MKIKVLWNLLVFNKFKNYLKIQEFSRIKINNNKNWKRNKVRIFKGMKKNKKQNNQVMYKMKLD